MDKSKINILIIDDEPRLRNLLKRIVSLEGYNVDTAETATEGLKKFFKSPPHLLLTDVILPDGNGIDILRRCKQEYPETEIIVLTAFGKIEDGVKAMKIGAHDYLSKGDENDKIVPLLNNAAAKAYEQWKSIETAEEVTVSDKSSDPFKAIIGESDKIKTIVKLAKKVAKTNATVLLLGETGTGKEVFAKAIHEDSKRKDKPFFAINCAALNAQLLESELFGHVAGAFTDAKKDKDGLFTAADNGTVFLDEMGEMDIELQSKLLRVLESGTFMKVGDTKEQKVNVRIIAATNKNLEKESNDGRFRLDLYYRLSVFQLKLPPLRDRGNDIIVLAKHFVKRFSQENEIAMLKMDKKFEDRLLQHQWNGNVRELRNIIERAVIMTDGDRLEIESLPFDMQDEDGGSGLDLSAMEKKHIAKVLDHCKGNKTRAAEMLGIGLTTLYRKIQEYEIEVS
jgi:DNA-binding NtrC family response regulator